MRLIDAEVLLPNGVYYVNADDPMRSLDILLERIAGAPTIDAVSVVHCEDCWRWEQTGDCRHGICRLEGVELLKWKHDFCSYGERKDK